MKIEVLNGGSVELLESMGGDAAVVRAARCTSGSATKGAASDRQLIRFLMRHDHTSPFEFCELTWHVRAPIYVARQWVRHRTANWNEVSGRYTEFKEDYQRQERWRGQAVKNRQGSRGMVDYDALTWDAPCETKLDVAEDLAFQEYNHRIENGVAREQARTCLPLSTWTEWQWKCDLRNVLGFLRLRTSAHAQEEIRAYARAIEEGVKRVAPVSHEAWVDYQRDVVVLTRLDVAAIREWPIGAPPEFTDSVTEHAMRTHWLKVHFDMSPGEAEEHMVKRKLLEAAA